MIMYIMPYDLLHIDTDVAYGACLIRNQHVCWLRWCPALLAAAALHQAGVDGSKRHHHSCGSAFTSSLVL